jgi:hypothetical protein
MMIIMLHCVHYTYMMGKVVCLDYDDGGGVNFTKTCGVQWTHGHGNWLNILT